jgi:dUTP pyrophosphatase
LASLFGANKNSGTNPLSSEGKLVFLYQSSIMKVKIINDSNNPLPEYETDGSAGMDLRAHLDQPVMLKPLQRTLIPTGLYIELPKGFEAQIRPRSGLALKKGLSVLNTPGTIDSDYRGEIKIILINLSNETAIINTGERIAQMVISKYEKISLEEAVELSSTERGEGGFGHTGVV